MHEHQAAQALHTKEYKVNQSYRSFLIKAKDHPDAKRKQLQDLLVEPVQRISRYTMLLKGNANLTLHYERDRNTHTAP